MSKVVPVFLLCLGLLVLPAARAQDSPVLISSALPGPNPGFVVRKTVDEIQVSFTVTGADKRPVLGLRREQIALRDNQRPVESIVDFRSDDGLPLQLALMIDASGSMEKTFAVQQRLALDFLRRVVHRAGDRGVVIAFAGRLEQLGSVGANEAELGRAIGRLQAGGITALYDAMVTGCEQLAEAQPRSARRAIVLLSDGDDNNSFHTLQDVIERAQRAGTPVYAISVHKGQRLGDDMLRRLAAASGGRAFIVAKAEQLGSAFSDIEQELRSQYVVAFRPPAGARDGRFHTLQVSVPGAADLDIRARAGYWAPREEAR